MLEKRCFQETPLREVTIPETVREVQLYAFFGCGGIRILGNTRVVEAGGW